MPVLVKEPPASDDPRLTRDILPDIIARDALKLPYRVINKCTGDCGYLATYKQYDIEAWLPGQKEFMEVMTDTNATDYQARRMNIRYTKDGEKHFAHTVNDTGVAMGRMIIAIMDNYQNPDGTITVPQVLREYMGKDKISSK
jgi:seryl-tRNA synthetase